ncbi:MAG: GTP 3',8-cyclase MoaA, partial [Planctomycetota bacterium]|nr:GTP 3',8-cyclase MoaA [Planctomycetota bacterium]
MIDRFQRHVTYLRISVTDRCQMRCSYCSLPSKPQPTLSAAELHQIVGVAVARLGFRKVRLTGGEPLLRRDLGEIISGLASLEGMREVAVTTNGLGLVERAEELARAGLRTVNISCDSLRPERFRELAGAGHLEDVLAGLRACRTAGISNIKLNVVLMGGVNDDEVDAFVDFAAAEAVEVRFIEQMPLSGGAGGKGAAPNQAGMSLDPAAIVEQLAARRTLKPLPASKAGGPAERYSIDGAVVGFIRAISGPFCDRCNRLRITSDGKIRSCLLTGGDVDLAQAVRRAGTAKEIEGRIEALLRQAADSKPAL